MRGLICLFAGLLTKKFVSLIQGSEDRTLDLNRTADVLEVYQMSLASELGLNNNLSNLPCLSIYTILVVTGPKEEDI